MSYVILILALLLEVIGTSLLKYSYGFSHIVSGCLAYVLYGISLYMFSVAIKTIPLVIADTIWQGLGIVLISLVSMFVFKENISIVQYAFILITMIGVIGLGISP